MSLSINAGSLSVKLYEYAAVAEDFFFLQPSIKGLKKPEAGL